MNKTLETIIDEQYFPYVGMSLEQRNYYLNIIKNCKDVCDSENKIYNHGNGIMVAMSLKKEDAIVKFNGTLTFGPEGMHENRCIEGILYLKEKSIIVDYKITRLCVKEEPKEYRVFDEFKLENDVLKRKSLYDYNFKSICDEIDNDEMKGKLK